MTSGASDPAAPPPNAIGAALGLLGDEWTLLILRYSFQGVRRFSELRSRLGIADGVLTNRLDRLTEEGLLERVRYSERPERFEYRLTAAGADTWALLLSIWAWERRWAAGQAHLLPRMRHRSCGAEFTPELCCAACRATAGPAEVSGDFGPGGSFAGSIPSGSSRRRGAVADGRRGGAAAGPGLFPETMSIIGNRWASGVLGAAFLGSHRFVEFQRNLGAPPNMVSDRLRTFIELGVLDQPGGGRKGYHLSAKGRALFPVVMALVAWGERWRPAAEGPTLLLRHDGCGAPFVPELHCSQCREPLSAPQVDVVPVEHR